MNFIEYRDLSKEYRNKKDITLLKNLIFNFEIEYQHLLYNKEVFDEIAFYNMLFFLLTQKFRTEVSVYIERLEISNPDMVYKDFNKIQDEYISLNNKSKEINNKDYRYVWEYNLAIKETLRVLKRHLESEDIDIDQQKHNKDIGFVKEVRKSFINSIDIFNTLFNNSKKKNHVPIYAPFNQCQTNLNIININGENFEIKLFIDSSHVLPIDYNYDKNLFDKLTDDIKNLFADIHLVISENNKKYYLEFLKTSIEKSQHNSIQVIAIFSGLIAFVTVAAKSTLRQDSDIKNIFLYLTAFSILFSIFLLLLRRILSSSKVFDWIVIIIFITTFIVLANYYHIFY